MLKLIKSLKSKEDKQNIGQNKRTKHCKLKIKHHEPHYKPGMNGRVSRSYSSSELSETGYHHHSLS